MLKFILSARHNLRGFPACGRDQGFPSHLAQSSHCFAATRNTGGLKCRSATLPLASLCFDRFLCTAYYLHWGQPGSGARFASLPQPSHFRRRRGRGSKALDLREYTFILLASCRPVFAYTYPPYQQHDREHSKPCQWRYKRHPGQFSKQWFFQ